MPDLPQASTGVIADQGGRRMAAVPTRRRVLAWAPLFLLLHGSALSAPQNIGGTPDAAYLAAVSGRGLQAEIAYLPPTAPLDLAEEPPKPRPTTNSAENVAALRWLLIIVAGAVLVFLAALVIRNGSWARASFARPLSVGARRAPPSGPPPGAAEPAEPPGLRLLAELARLPDRREALRRLTGYALERATRANGIRLGRSQTARDIVRFLPAGWRHIASLSLVVRTEEVVRFGGEPLSDAVFADCLATMRPLFADHGAT